MTDRVEVTDDPKPPVLLAGIGPEELVHALRVDTHGGVIVAEESIDAIASRVVELLGKSNA